MNKMKDWLCLIVIFQYVCVFFNVETKKSAYVPILHFLTQLNPSLTNNQAPYSM